MILPFCERTIAHGMTFGLGPAGYDIRIRDAVILWPKSCKNVDAYEFLDIPTDLKPNVLDKSSWVRLGVTVQNTTIEPGWRGVLRVELINHSWWFRRIRAGAPIAQIEFPLLDEPTEMPYRGRYQNQQPGTDFIPAKEGDL